MAGTFDVIPKRKRITFFKLGKLWVFKHFFDNKEMFAALLDYYNKDQYRFEFNPPVQGIMPSSSWSETALTTIWWRI